MGYKIRYDAVGGPTGGDHKRKWTGTIALICVLACLLGALVVKNYGLPWVQEVLLPGDPAVTAAALENLASDLRSGTSLWDAITAFCREIMQHGISGQ